MNHAYRPMLATLVKEPFDNKDWVFETKWDGFRLIAEKRGAHVVLWSRNGINVTKKYPAVLSALKKIKHSCVLDGELCALDARGRSRFQLLQNANSKNQHKKTTLLYVVFDLLFLDGDDLRKRPLLERKALVRSILPRHKLLRYSAHVARTGRRAFAKAKKRGEEGVMAKRAAGRYYSGKRTREWLKFKAVKEQEVVIVGYTAPRRTRKFFGSLVLAVRAGKTWSYVGHVGTGFDDLALRTIYSKLVKLRTTKKPLHDKVKFEPQTTWVRPVLVCEVKFTEWTHGGEMRHPVYLGLRTDKKAAAVVREIPK